MEKLGEQFNKTGKALLQKELNAKNIFEVPRIEKIVVSTGVGDFKENKDMIDKIAVELARITGQHAKLNIARKSVSAFKLREGQPVGLSVTLRGERMYDFLSKLINVALPRVRDFRGLSLKAFDNQGNYSVGIKEYSIFPEVRYEDIVTNFGLQINVKTSAKNNEEAKALLVTVGFPFEKAK
ncbi:MAG: 50S ribosomal protein L5 [Patescibacteria group bacterium]|jgi:large subunit ribosomal protein L5